MTVSVDRTRDQWPVCHYLHISQNNKPPKYHARYLLANCCFNTYNKEPKNLTQNRFQVQTRGEKGQKRSHWEESEVQFYWTITELFSEKTKNNGIGVILPG